MVIEKFLKKEYLVSELNFEPIFYILALLENAPDAISIISSDKELLEMYCKTMEKINNDPGNMIVDSNTYFIEDNIVDTKGFTTLRVIDYLINSYTDEDFENSRIRFYKLKNNTYFGQIITEKGNINFIPLSKNGTYSVSRIYPENIIAVAKALKLPEEDVEHIKKILFDKTENDLDKKSSKIIKVFRKYLGKTLWL